MRLKVTCIMLLAFASLSAQENMVLNPGFELTTRKKSGIYEISADKNPVRYWYGTGKSESYLFRAPKEYVAMASSGENTVGLILGSSGFRSETSYLTGRLKNPLRKGQTYCVCFDMLLHRTSLLAASEVGIILHHDSKLLSAITDPSTINATLYANNGQPVTNTKWQRYCGYYLASGGEKYLSFGKFGEANPVKVSEWGKAAFPFKDDYQKLAFYQLDSISVSAIENESQCGCAESLPGIRDTSAQLPPYLFALDASGSMAEKGLFDSLRMSLSGFVDQLPDKSPVSFSTFANSTNQIFAGGKESNTSRLVNDKLLSSDVGGSTNALLGLAAAYESWPTEEPDSARLVFISDGEFRVTQKMIDLVKDQYDRYGRKIILIQIGSEATGLLQLRSYLQAYIHITPPEINQVITSLLLESGQSIGTRSCQCLEKYAPISNFHFIIDYSYSMVEENAASVRAFRYLFDTVPDSALISLTLFNNNSIPLYLGNKANTSVDAMLKMLTEKEVYGGTVIPAGVNSALKVARENSYDRFNALILITDQATAELALLKYLGDSITTAAENAELSLSVVHFYMDDAMQTATSQFDMITKTFYTVSKKQFEEDLFARDLEKCDYRSQPHYSGKRMGAVKVFIQEVQREYIQDASDWE